ncbi:PucR family transcriptional regulator [Streptomyces parvulus]|uniref:PucR family transcriptional regulator n=1 Tax=Streptomyces parvulus TaxID=146923 RepID=UPI003798FD8D
MHVAHLLQDASLGLRPLWSEEALLTREISGVTVTDLEDPARFVRPGEVVLSGLVWWSAEGGPDRAERFVRGLRDAGAVALLAGEETHGSVPGDLVEACARHAMPVAGVPAEVMFRAITDTVYLRQWGDLSRHRAGRHDALPEHVRLLLHGLVAREAGPAEILAAAFPPDPPAAHLLTSAGRTVASTPGAGPGAVRVPAAGCASPSTVRVPAGDDGGVTVAVRDPAPGSDGGVTVAVDTDADVTPYERWWLHLPDAGAAPPRLLHEITAVLGRCQEALVRRRTAVRRAADGLGAALTADDAGEVAAAARACGLPAEGPYRVVAADAGTRRGDLALGALTEAVAHTGPEWAAVGSLPGGTAFAVLPEEAAAGLAPAWPLVCAAEPGTPVHAGLSAPSAGPAGLPGALAEARYALAAARTTAPAAPALTDATGLTSLDALLTGVPAEVRAAFSRSTLGPLLDTTGASAAALLNTLEVFLAHDGSWARTAEAMHLHVNTVHYRIRRIEHFTGRDLSRLSDRLDLWAALLCRTEPDGGRPVPAPRRARPTTSSAR